MRRIKDLLRLSASGRSQREIARALGTANSTVSDYLTRARRAGVAWPAEALIVVGVAGIEEDFLVPNDVFQEIAFEDCGLANIVGRKACQVEPVSG